MRLPPTRLLALGAAAAAATIAYLLHRRRLRSKLAAAPISEWAKVELHVHFDGAFDWDVVYEAAPVEEVGDGCRRCRGAEGEEARGRKAHTCLLYTSPSPRDS